MFDKVDVLSLAAKFQFYSNSGFNDLADFLSFRYSVCLLVLSSSLIMAKQYIWKPISCYMSTNVGGINLIDYIENYCWVEGTIPITYEGSFPTNEKEWILLEKEKILYYQWVPFILLLQAVLFYLPQLIWQLFYTKNSGMDLKHLMLKANNASNLDNEERSKEVLQLARALETLIFQTREYRTGKLMNIRKRIKKISSLCIASKRLGTHLMVFYLFVKVLYLVNSISQVFIMQSFLNLKNSNYTFFGTKILHDIINGKDWQNTLVFSRVTYCVAKIRHYGGVNYAVAQCVLPVNMLNEKLYIFFWFWMVMVATATCISLIVWVIRLMVQKNKTQFIRRYLILNDDYKCGNKSNKRIKRFEDHFLRNDGIFILQMLASNTGDIITAEIVGQLWKIYKEKYELRISMKDPSFNNGNQITRLNSERIVEKCQRPLPTAPKINFRQSSFDL